MRGKTLQGAAPPGTQDAHSPRMWTRELKALTLFLLSLCLLALAAFAGNDERGPSDRLRPQGRQGLSPGVSAN